MVTEEALITRSGNISSSWLNQLLKEVYILYYFSCKFLFLMHFFSCQLPNTHLPEKNLTYSD